MTPMRKQGGLLVALAAWPKFFSRRRLERNRAEALKTLIGRNDNHLLDDIGMRDPSDAVSRTERPGPESRKPWML